MRYIDFKDNYATEESCKVSFKNYREQMGIKCKKCQGELHYWLPQREMYQCKNRACKFRTSLKSGTVMENSKMSFYDWFLAIHLMTASKMNISALEIQRQIGHKYYEPIFDMAHKLRRVMGKRDAEYQLDGFLELDEGYFSNSKPLERNEFTGEQEKLKRGKGSQKKSKVLVMNSYETFTSKLKRDNPKYITKPKYLKMTVIEDVISTTINHEVEKSISSDAILKTDDNKAYKDLKTLVKAHHPHNVSKVKVGKVLPWVHKAISNSKAILNAIHHGISGDYLQNYLDEYCYKYNRRHFGEKLFERLVITCALYTWY